MDHKRPDTLPNNWVKTSIGAIYDVIGGGTPSTSIAKYWGGDTPWITSADIDGVREIKVIRYVTQKGIQESTTNKVPNRTLLVVTRVGLGKIAISDKPICFSQDLQGLVQRLDLIFPEYSLFYLSFELQRLKFEGRGTTISGITKKQLKDTGFPLPPYQEQRRIVAKIDELFSELDKGIESLKTARRQLEVYRQSILKHAFEGKLTAQWREENKDKLEKPEQLPARIKQEREARYERQLQEWRIAVKEWEGKGKPGKKPGKPMPLKSVWQIDSSKIKQLPSIPDGWQWVSFSWLLSTEKKSIKTGPFGTMLKKHEHQEVGVPVLGIENIGGGKFIKGNKIFVSEKKAVALRSFEVEPGELIISRSGTVGEICTVPEGLGKTLISTNLLRVSLNQNVVLSQIFVFMFQGGGTVRKQVKELCKGSSRDFLNQSILQSVVFPICSLQEQIQIIREIGKRLSLTDQLLRSIDSELVKSSSLRQSILKKAFSGQLVAQDPSDEPASVLLARIKAEKEQIGKKTETT